jgi:hypothetical protein
MGIGGAQAMEQKRVMEVSILFNEAWVLGVPFLDFKVSRSLVSILFNEAWVLGEYQKNRPFSPLSSLYRGFAPACTRFLSADPMK